MNNEFRISNYNPDIISCLASLSSDEIFTPPSVVNSMLDMLPQELFADPKTTFLDPACKSGVFLREIAKRLIVGLAHAIPNPQDRIDHIFHHQLFGIAITELTSLISRRSIYCSKYPNSKYSVSYFQDVQGNIRFKNTIHNWTNTQEKCSFCGASKSEYNRPDSLESHAYEFIHTTIPEDIFKMKFDVIIGNPPYQISDSGNGVSAAPIFHLFVEQAKKLNPRYLSMIIPARWYAGGKGLKDFRKSMLEDSHIRTIVDYESSKDCFEGVNIAGGICYFLWDRNYSGKCRINNMINGVSHISERQLNEFPILIRSNMAISIVHKILDKTSDMLCDHALPRNPFGFATNFRGREKKRPGDIQILTSKGFQFVDRQSVKTHIDAIDKYKILIGRLVPSNGELDVNPMDGYRVITDTRILKPEQINTETYLDIGVFASELEALNFEQFLKTKFVRFLLRQAISSLNVSRECFRFVPYEDFSQKWTDSKLYQKYGLSNNEISYIEALIRPIESGEDSNG